MAFLVCFHEAGSKQDWSKKAIYIEQSLYELLFHYYMRHPSDSTLKAMVSIGYDDEFMITEGRIAELLNELDRLVVEREVKHPQIPPLCDVLRDASSRKCELAVAGDMYPDLSCKSL